MLLGLFCVCYHSSFKLWLTTVENRQNWNTVITLHSFRCFFCSFISHYLKESLLLCTVALFRTVILVLLADCGFIVCLLLLRILIISLFSLCIVLGTVQIVWPFHSTIFLSYVICRNCTLCKHTIIKLLFRLGADPWWITLNCVKPACSGDWPVQISAFGGMIASQLELVHSRERPCRLRQVAFSPKRSCIGLVPQRD